MPVESYSGEFLNSIMKINFGASYEFPSTKIIQYERRTSWSALYALYGVMNPYMPTHFGMSYNINADILPIPPIIFLNETQGLKFGVRGGYKFSYIQQELNFKITERKQYKFTGDLMKYRTWLVGPIIYYTPFVKTSETTGDYTSNAGFTFFFLYGNLGNGKLTAFPTKMDLIEKMGGYLSLVDPTTYYQKLATQLLDMGIVKTKFNGYSLNYGIGGELSFCAVNIGMNFVYSQTHIKLKYPVYTLNAINSGTGLPLSPTNFFPIYSLGKNILMYTYAIELYLSIPVEWLKKPSLF
jgi:hypothetical protein